MLYTAHCYHSSEYRDCFAQLDTHLLHLINLYLFLLISLFLSLCLSLCLSMSLSISLSISLSLYIYIYVYIYIYIFLYIYLRARRTYGQNGLSIAHDGFHIISLQVCSLRFINCTTISIII